MNSKLPRLSFDNLRILTSVYALFYVLFSVSAISSGEFIFNQEGIGFFILFLLFIVSFFTSWFNELLTGLLLLLWNVGVWCLELFFEVQSGGFGIVSGLPLIIFGVFFILKGWEKRKGVRLNSDEKWKIGLKILVITFSALYLIVVISNLTGNLTIDYLKSPGIFLILLLILYFTGFMLYWKNEFYAGILFVIWYLGVIIVYLTSFEFSNSGPWGIAGVVILITGLLLVKNKLSIKTK